MGTILGSKGGPKINLKMETKMDLETSGPKRPPTAGNGSWEGTFAPDAGFGVAVGVV